MKRNNKLFSRQLLQPSHIINKGKIGCSVEVNFRYEVSHKG